MVDPGLDRAERTIQRANRARAFLEEGIFREAWEELDARVMDEWRRTAPGEMARREELHRLLAAMTALENILTGYVDAGTIAHDILAQTERERAVHG